MLKILPERLQSPEVIALLEEHLADMRATSPPESVHALDLEGLLAANVQFWSAWEESENKQAQPRLVGCVALKRLSATEAELKSMRTSQQCRGKGFGRQLLQFVIAQATEQNFHQIFLETGTQEFFKPARTLYAQHGFEYCGPFSDYREDPHSTFMCLLLTEATGQ